MKKPKIGDKVRITVEGTVTRYTSRRDEFRVDSASGNGVWIEVDDRDWVVEVIEAALQVGWHRCRFVSSMTHQSDPDGSILARYWDGSRWQQSEISHPSTGWERRRYESLDFLGGGA